MKDLPLQAGGSRLQTALDLKKNFGLAEIQGPAKAGGRVTWKSLFKELLQKQIGEERLGLLFRLNHCQAPVIHFSALLLNYCAKEKMCFTAQRGPEVTDLSDFNFQQLLRIVGKNRI